MTDTPPHPVRTITLDIDGTNYTAALHEPHGADNTWQISDTNGTVTVTVLAGHLDQAQADLTRAAAIQRGYAQPHLDHATNLDHQHTIVTALAQQLE